METKRHSAAFMQNRKFYTFLPLLILPFITLGYWAVGIKMIYKHQAAQSQPQGLNTSLPDPKLKDESAFSKLSYYKQALDDSAKIREQLKKDPYRSAELLHEDTPGSGNALQGLGAPQTMSAKQRRATYKGKEYSGPHQTRIVSKLKSLDSVLAQTADPQFKQELSNSGQIKSSPSSIPEKDLQSLEAAMANLESEEKPNPVDPELEQLNGMLEKILDIQYPERAAQKLRSQSSESDHPSYAVQESQQITSISSFGESTPDTVGGSISSGISETNGFFSLDDPVSASTDNAIRAVVHEQQTLITGSNIKLRLSTDVYVAGTLIPKNSFVYGSVSVNGERLLVEINSIRLNNSIFPVKLSVYDLDGQAGIYIPGSISRNVAKQSLSQDIQGLSVGTLDPSLGAQAASAGIQAAKSLLGRKAKLIQVSVKAGYQVLLRDGNLKSI